MTRDTYLEVTYRQGKPVAAYLYFPGGANAEVARTQKMKPGLVADFAADGRPIGLEIVSPSAVSLQDVNEVLQSLNKEALPEEEFAPLNAG